MRWPRSGTLYSFVARRFYGWAPRRKLPIWHSKLANFGHRHHLQPIKQRLMPIRKTAPIRVMPTAAMRRFSPNPDILYSCAQRRPSETSHLARALSDQTESFDRDYFTPWLGALRMAMLSHRQRCATTPRGKRTRPSVGRIGSPAALRRLPDSCASRFAPRLTGKPIRPIKLVPFGRIVL